jgi:hypothetical protein
MTKTSTNRISTEGRARMAEAGRRNVQQLAASRQNRREIREEAAQLRCDLLAALPVDASPGMRALALSAATSQAALALLLQQILAARSYRRIELLTGLLQPLQSELRRTLALLGVTPQPAGDPTDSVPSVEDLVAQIDAEKAVKHKENHDGHSRTDG